MKLRRINTGCFTIGDTSRLQRWSAGDFALSSVSDQTAGGYLWRKKRIADINKKGYVVFVAHIGEEALVKSKETKLFFTRGCYSGT